MLSSRFTCARVALAAGVALAAQFAAASSHAAPQSYPLYCRAGMKSIIAYPEFLGVFHWAKNPAGVTPPSPYTCAWADRLPRGAEIRPGDTEALYSSTFLPLQTVSLNQYVKICVYRDPATDRLVASPAGPGAVLVAPPFSRSPAGCP
jgi:hypothetical protein